MSNRKATGRVPYVGSNGKREPGIYTRRAADGGEVFVIGWRDAAGTQRWRTVRGGVRAARARLAEEHAKRARGERVAADPRLRFDDAAEQWWNARVVKLRPATQSAYAACLVHLRKPEHFGRARMIDITHTDVAKYVTTQEQAGLKGWTIRGHLTVLSAVFTYGTRHLGLVAVNPVSLLDKEERPSSDDEKPKRILNPDELRGLLDAVDDDYRLMFELAAETGVRLGEALGVVWGNVDLEAEAISLTHQLDRKGQRVPLKTKRSRRTLEVTPQLTNKLRVYKLASPASGPHDLVFTSASGTPFDHRNIGGRVMARAVEDADLCALVEIDGKRVRLTKKTRRKLGRDAVKSAVVIEPAPTFHALRHSHASQLIAAGWDIEEISSRLGHSSVEITMRIYVHQFDAARRSDDRRNRLAKLYGMGAPVGASDGSGAQQTATGEDAEVLQLRADGSTSQ